MKAKFLYTAGTGFYINNLHGISIDLTGTVRWQGKVIGGEQEGLVGPHQRPGRQIRVLEREVSRV